MGWEGSGWRFRFGFFLFLALTCAYLAFSFRPSAGEGSLHKNLSGFASSLTLLAASLDFYLFEREAAGDFADSLSFVVGSGLWAAGSLVRVLQGELPLFIISSLLWGLGYVPFLLFFLVKFLKIYSGERQKLVQVAVFSSVGLVAGGLFYSWLVLLEGPIHSPLFVAGGLFAAASAAALFLALTASAAQLRGGTLFGPTLICAASFAALSATSIGYTLLVQQGVYSSGSQVNIGWAISSLLFSLGIILRKSSLASGTNALKGSFEDSYEEILSVLVKRVSRITGPIAYSLATSAVSSQKIILFGGKSIKLRPSFEERDLKAVIDKYSSIIGPVARTIAAETLSEINTPKSKRLLETIFLDAKTKPGATQ